MKNLLFLLFSILLAYGNDWAPRYVSWFSGTKLEIIGRLPQWRQDCPVPPGEKGRCTDRYVIPKSSLGHFKEGATIGIGLVVYATEISCRTSFTHGSPRRKLYGDPKNPGSVLDIIHTYQSASYEDLRCEEDIQVDAYSPWNLRRHGHGGSAAVVGEANAVGRVKRLVEFFTILLPVILTALLIGFFGFNFLLSKLSKTPAHPMVFETYSISWMGFAIVGSGLAQILLPIIPDNFVFIRLSNGFTLMAQIGSAAALIAANRTQPAWARALGRFFLISVPGFLRIQLAQLLVIILAVSPWFGVSIAPSCLVQSSLYLLLGWVGRDSLLFSLGAAIAMDTTRLYNLSYAPHSNVSLIFVLLSVASVFLLRVIEGAGFVQAIRWSQEQIEGYNENRSLLSILGDFAVRFDVRRVTLIEPQKEGRCRIVIQQLPEEGGDGASLAPEILFRDRLPPVFAHVLSTGEALWHVEEDSPLANELRHGHRSNPERFSLRNHRHFSVIPLMKDSVPVAGIAITGYSDSYVRDEEKKLAFRSALSLLSPFLANLVAHGALSEQEQWSSLCARAEDDMLALRRQGRAVNAPVDLQQIGEALVSRLDLRVVIHRWDESTQQLGLAAIAGYSDKVTHIYRKNAVGKISTDEQGPLPLCLRRRRMVTVPDAHWLRGVVPAPVATFLEISETQSYAAVPIVLTNGIWGALCLDSTVPGRFNPRSEAGLDTLGKAIAALIEEDGLIGESARVRKALAGFVPAPILTKLLEGRDVREVETGYLLMADLKESTRLSQAVGAERWAAFMSSISGPVEELAKQAGYSLQSIIWDAFYLTRAAPPSPSEAQTAVELARQLNAFFAYACQDAFTSLLEDDGEDRARFGLVHGDITRDLRSGLTDSWTIVGTAMAEVSKLEQGCKAARGWLFASSSVFPQGAGSAWEPLDQRVLGTAHHIFRFDDPRTRATIPLATLKPLIRRKAG